MRAAHAAFSQGIRRSLSTSDIISEGSEYYEDDDEDDNIGGEREENHNSKDEYNISGKPPKPPRRKSSSLLNKLLPKKKSSTEQQAEHIKNMQAMNRELVLPPGKQISDKELKKMYNILNEVAREATGERESNLKYWFDEREARFAQRASRENEDDERNGAKQRVDY